MPKNPSGRSDEEQKEHEKSMAEHQAWLERENLRAVRGRSTAITGYDKPSDEQQTSAKAFLDQFGIPMPGTEAPPELVPPKDYPDVNVPEGLPPNILDQFNTRGWFAPDTTIRGRVPIDTGKPQTFEAQQFVLDYFARYGMLPTSKETTQFQQTGAYDPNSTMGELGFENYQQYVEAGKEGERFGPLAGGDVPIEGTIVVTDNQGNPIARYSDVNRPEVQQAISEGRVVQPDNPLYYNQPQGVAPELSVEEVVQEFGTPQMYLEGLSDHLNDLVRQDRPKIDALWKQLDAIQEGINTQVDGINEHIKNIDPNSPDAENERVAMENLYNTVIENGQQRYDETAAQLDSFFTEDKSKIEYAKSRDAIAQGMPIGELPYFQEVLPTVQAKATEAEQQNRYAREGQGPPVTAPSGPQRERVAPQSSQGDYMNYVSGLGVAPEYQQYLNNQYFDLLAMWKKSYTSDYPSFIGFVNNYLASGGRL